MNNVSSSNSQKALVPEIRFPEFRDDLQQSKLSDISVYKTKRATDVKSHYISTENLLQNCMGIVPYTDETAIDGISFSINDILLGNIRPYLKKAWLAEFDGVCSTDVLVLHPLKIEPSYFKYLICRDKFFTYVMSSAKGSKMPRGDKAFIMDMTISLPSINEQKKLASMLTLIDTLISKQEKMVDELKLYKRGVLSSLFEQKVSFVKDSNWTTKSLGDVFTERTERATGNEELLSVTINDGIQKREELDSKDNSSENKSNYKKVYVDDIAYNTMRMWQGASGHSPFNGIVSPAYTVIKLNDKDNHSIKFWSFYFKHIPLIKTFQKFSQGLTSDTWNLKYPQLAQIRVSYPSYDEQQKIVSILETIDTKILAEEKSLENLVLYKKQLLHKMFI